MAFFVFEYLLQKIVNNIFFSQYSNELWTTSKLFTTAIAGIMLTPMLLLMVYFGLSIENSLVYTLAIVVFAGVRVRMENADPPRAFRGFPLTLITAGLLAMAFSCFSGINL